MRTSRTMRVHRNGGVGVTAAVVVLGTLWLYATAGDLDPTFGKAGVILLENRVTAMMVQPDAKVLVAIADDLDYPYSPGVLARYDEGGGLDPSFGSGGSVGNVMGCPFAFALEPDGDIIVAGYDCVGPVSGEALTLERYTSNGELDVTFGVSGRVVTAFQGAYAEARSVLLQPDGKIVATGYVFDKSDGQAGGFALSRYNSDGTQDQSFGTGGSAITEFGGQEVPVAAVLQTDGKIVLGGIDIFPYPSDIMAIALARYNIDGTLDSTFGDAGKVIARFNSGTGPYRLSQVQDMALQSDGKILVVGSGSSADEEPHMLARFEANGTLDASFGVSGFVRTDFGAPYQAGCAMALQPDGKIVTAGFAVVGSSDMRSLATILMAASTRNLAMLENTLKTSARARWQPPSHCSRTAG